MSVRYKALELCQSRGGRPGQPVPCTTVRAVSADVNQQWTNKIMLVRAQELCKSRGGRPGRGGRSTSTETVRTIRDPNCPYCLYGCWTFSCVRSSDPFSCVIQPATTCSGTRSASWRTCALASVAASRAWWTAGTRGSPTYPTTYPSPLQKCKYALGSFSNGRCLAIVAVVVVVQVVVVAVQLDPWMKWRGMVHGWMVHIEYAEMATVSSGTSHVTTKTRCMKLHHLGGYSQRAAKS